MRIEFSRRADREIERAARWWVEHRADAPTLLREELAEYLEKLKKTPHLGEPWRVVRGMEIRKVRMPRTQKKLYVMHVAPDLVRIVCLWGGQRGRDPKL